MSSATHKGLWNKRVQTQVEEVPGQASHPGIFSASLRGGPQTSTCTTGRSHHSESRVMFPRVVAVTTPSPLTPVKSPSNPSTEPGSSSPEGSIRQDSSPRTLSSASDDSADESGSLSPPAAEKVDARPPAPVLDPLCEEMWRGKGAQASFSDRIEKEGILQAAARARGIGGGPLTELRDLGGEMADLAREFGGAARDPCASHTPRFMYKYVRGGKILPPQDSTEYCVSAARAAASRARGLSGELGTELRDLESEMADLTRGLLAIRAALPTEAVNGEVDTSGAGN